jgi:hypothetical protein
MKEKEQNFDALKKLLQLKQHEVPPPGYFNSFSDKVVARIQAGEAVKPGLLSEWVQYQAPWLGHLVSALQAKPPVIAGFATALCLLLVVGLVLTEKAENATVGLVADFQNPVEPTMSMASVNSQLLADGGGGIQISTNPISLQPAANLFGQQNPLIQLQTASFAR